jgi:signal transduction histidine kinase
MSSDSLQTVLVVDDAPENITLLSSILGEHYRVKVALNGEKALSIAQSDDPPDIILLDIMMPGIDGYEVCRILKDNEVTEPIPVIFVTGVSDALNEEHGLDIGAVDYITKPVSPSLVLARVKTQLRLYNQSRHLEELVEQRTRELMKTQAQLMHAEKMESVGRLAAGVAHEVKNPLAIIRMGAYYLSSVVESEEGLAEVLHDIDDAVQRADDVIMGLLDFSHDSELALKDGDLNDVVQRSLHLVAHEMRQRNIEVSSELSEEIPSIQLDAGKLQQVLINIFINSAQAMERDGQLAVSTRLKTLDSELGDSFATAEHVLWLEVADSGPGFCEDDRDKIFDPFYTTKPVGEGTGLGLSVSRKIMSLHNGLIDIRNKPEGGAAVSLVFKITNGVNE